MTGPGFRRGVTLIEIMVGMVIGLLLTTAAVAFVRSESRLMNVTEDRLDMVQASRVVLNLVASDIRSAGLGLRPSAGEFRGLLTGQFDVGGVVFGVAGNTVQLEQADRDQPLGFFSQYQVPTQDLGVRLADGEQATIVEFNGKGSSAGTMTICDHAGMRLRNLETVLLQDQPSLSTFAVELTSVGSPVTCAECRNGCIDLGWQEPATDGRRFDLNDGTEQSYQLGQMFSGFQTIAWFVTPDPNRPDRAVLRRMTWDDTQPDCGARDNTCGALVARNVEGFFYRVYQFTPVGGWVEVPPGTNPAEDGRVRVDIELVMRAEEAADKTFPQVQALLAVPVAGAPQPFPPAARDRIERRVFRATVELRNAGRI